MSGSWEFQAAIHFSATAASRSVVDFQSGEAAIAGRTSMTSRMALVRTRFMFIFIPRITSIRHDGPKRQQPETLRDYSNVAKSASVRDRTSAGRGDCAEPLTVCVVPTGLDRLFTLTQDSRPGLIYAAPAELNRFRSQVPPYVPGNCRSLASLGMTIHKTAQSAP